MSTAPVLLLPGGRLVSELDAQHTALGDQAPERLFVTCDESRTGGPATWEQRMPGSLFLRTPGAQIRGTGVREAILYAVEELGLRHVVVVGHSRCDHLDAGDPALAPAFLSGSGADEPAPLMDRIYAGIERGERQLAAARADVREAVHTLDADPEIGGIGVVVSGLVEIVETGVLLVYQPEEDRFEALL
jgi:carbonic anhydrase